MAVSASYDLFIIANRFRISSFVFPLSPPRKHLALSLPKGRTDSLFSASEEVIAHSDANTHHKLLFLVNSTSAWIFFFFLFLFPPPGYFFFICCNNLLLWFCERYGFPFPSLPSVRYNKPWYRLHTDNSINSLSLGPQVPILNREMNHHQFSFSIIELYTLGYCSHFNITPWWGVD